MVPKETNERQGEAYEKLLDTYFDQIRERYMEGDFNVRFYLIGKLEKIVKGEMPQFERGFLFDGSKAREIRLSKNLTYRALSKKLNVAVASLTSYEKGNCVPRGTKGKGGRRYLEWLKDEGYDPFNLNSEK